MNKFILTIMAMLIAIRAFSLEIKQSLELAGQKLVVEVVSRKASIPWAMQELPDGNILLTQREGNFALLDPNSGKLTVLPGAPLVHAKGQGGLLDLKLSPNFATDKLIYFTYSHWVLNQGQTTALGRAKFDQGKISDVTELWLAQAWENDTIHYGSRLAFDDQGHIFVSIGERGNRDKAQKTDNHQGKIVRLTLEGKPATGNPFIGQSMALPEIYSLGHRNPQGLWFDFKNQKLYVTEHGPQGGDELNLVKAGANYGWPVITYGREYWGPKIGEGTHKSGLEQPLYQYTPSIAPCDLIFYEHDLIKGLKNTYLTGALKLTHLNVLKSTPDGKFAESRLFENEKWRIRSLLVTRKGELYIGVDQGLILRLRP